MIGYRHTTKIIIAAMTVAVCLCLAAVLFSERLRVLAEDTGIAMEYETALFDTAQPITVNIIMEESDWEDMLENAAEENYYSCDVEINGTRFYKVGIRPKGNTSLSTIVSDPTTDRYSLKLEFDHYVEGQTCYGLDKLILNNNYADATSMKEALIYDMYQYLGADASLYNYAGVSVNGEYWGCYLALEGVEDSFLLRNYGVSSGNLYKPEGMQMGQEGGFGSGSGGADLNYTDDELDSYSTIWDGEIGNTGKKDHKRVVEALKHISEGTELEEYMDIDNLLKYMAVHVFSVNEDSLSGSMAHNYYLYESGGKLNLIPWDYNLAFGGMGSNAASVINSPIDGAFSGTTFFDTLMENEEYKEKYYDYLEQLVKEYVDGGRLDAFYEQTRGNIDQLLEEDPTAFYTYEEYDEAAELLMRVVRLRSESVEGQVNGTIPSTKAEQTDSDALIDGSDIDLTVMGTMNAGGGNGPGEFRQNGNGPGEFKQNGDDQSDTGQETSVQDENEQGNPVQEASVQDENGQGNPMGNPPGNPPGGDNAGADGKMAAGQTPGNIAGSKEAQNATEKNIVLYAVSFGILIFALAVAVLFRRRPRKR